MQMTKTLVYLITDGTATSDNFQEKSQQILNLIRAAVENRISLIQIREKQLSARDLFELAKSIATITQNTETKLLINDRADIALAAKADGVHLTANSLSPTIIRQSFSVHLIIGVSAHSIEDVLKAKTENADFVTFSPIFATPSKIRYGAPQGLEKLRAACNTAENFPVIALGGVDEINFPKTLNAGASGFAAIRLLNKAENLSEIMQKLKDEQRK